MQTTEGMEVKKGNHAPRYCKTCEHYKPPRGESWSYPGLPEGGGTDGE